MSYAIQIEGVSKRFGTHVAVDALSLTIPRGVIYGVLGPNGAGKSTTLRMINDILGPDEGTIRLLDGLRPGREAAPYIGFLPEERGLYPKMSPLEVGTFMGELRGLTRRDARAKSRAWLVRLGLSEWLDQRVQTLSKGMQQKVQFATCLVHEPTLVILDEPWSGLDPVNADVLRDIVRDLAKLGTTIVLSTHVMEQAEQLCDAVAIIARGRLVREGRIVDLRNAGATDRIALAFHTPEQADNASTLLVDLTPSANGDTLDLTLPPDTSPGHVLARVLEAGLVPRRFEEVRPTLHQIFVDLVGATASEAARLPPPRHA